VSKTQPSGKNTLSLAAMHHGWNRFWSRTFDVKDENLCYLFSTEKYSVA